MTPTRWTQKELEKIPAPETGRAVYHDPGCRSLILVVTPKGTKTWLRYGRIDGKPTRIRIGTFPDFSIDSAREACRILTGDIARGDNPAIARREKRGEKTLQQLWEWYFESYAKKHKRSWKKDEQRWKNQVSPHASLKLSQCTRDWAEAVQRQVHDTCGPAASNLALELIRAMFNHAIKKKWATIEPTKGIKRYTAVKRERFLQADELPRFFSALELMKADERDFILLCLMTGVRRANVMSMMWAEVDFTSAIWCIPPEKAKAKRLIRIPLGDDVMALLLPRRENGSQWVFPNENSTTGHMVEPKRFWKDFKAKAELENLNIHDLRHTIASWQAALGTPLLMIAKSLGQASTISTERYSHINTDPVRKSMTQAYEAIKAAGAKEI
jgi:integrase